MCVPGKVRKNILWFYLYIFNICVFVFAVRLLGSFPRVTSTGALETNASNARRTHVSMCESRATPIAVFFFFSTLTKSTTSNILFYVHIGEHSILFTAKRINLCTSWERAKHTMLPTTTLCGRHEFNKLFFLNKEINLDVQFVFISFRFFACIGYLCWLFQYACFFIFLLRCRSSMAGRSNVQSVESIVWILIAWKRVITHWLGYKL